MEVRSVTCSAPVNIAVVKYWGKRDEELILPVNSSLSVTLSQEHLKATTSIAVSESFERNRIWLNGREESIENPRLQKCLKLFEEIAPIPGHVHICSENNFPTAAGLASSAAGYACLVYAFAALYEKKHELHERGDLSRIARQGSGSACRSMFGGFVKWEMGSEPSGSDSIAIQVAPETHWPDMRILILVVSDQKKSTSSTSGMQRTVETSKLLEYRATSVVPERMRQMEEAIQSKNYVEFAELTMKDSNQFHAVCLDTYPPITYLNDTSKKVIQFITRYNQYKGVTTAAYTFDAGPNAVLYLENKSVHEILSLLKYYFWPLLENGNNSFVKGIPVECENPSKELLSAIGMDRSPGEIQYIIHTKPGPGPQLLDQSQSLLTPEGYPRFSQAVD
ncbi:diphosphomevalonate decarboxylase-like [Oscarella lobularis]|uniref:diphosphomevalonate decarboxylase-like n=1 Tax=Oscarella lobularis TaxID=121494 RepID=UPI003313B6BC